MRQRLETLQKPELEIRVTEAPDNLNSSFRSPLPTQRRGGTTPASTRGGGGEAPPPSEVADPAGKFKVKAAGCCSMRSSAATSLFSGIEKASDLEPPAYASRMFRTVYSRFTLLGLSSVDTLKQTWTGDVFFELNEVLENTLESLQHASGDLLLSAARDGAPKCVEGDSDGLRLQTLFRPQDEAPLASVADITETRSAFQNLQKRLYNIKFNNVVEEQKDERWLNGTNLFDALKKGAFEVRGYRFKVLTRYLPGALWPSDSPEASPVFRQVTLGQLLLERVWSLECEPPPAPGASDAAGGGGESHPRRQPKSFPAFLREKWRLQGGMDDSEPPGRVLNKWMGMFWDAVVAGNGILAENFDDGVRNPFYTATSNGDPFNFLDPLGEVLNRFVALSFSTRVRNTYEHAFSLESFPADIQHPMVDISFQTPKNEFQPRKGGKGASSSRNSSPLPKESPGNKQKQSEQQPPAKVPEKWGVMFGLAREANTHDIRENMGFLEACETCTHNACEQGKRSGCIFLDPQASSDPQASGLPECKLWRSKEFDCMRIFLPGRSNLENLDWATCPVRSEWELPKMQPVDSWLSRAENSRTHKQYSHQRFSFTVSRIPSHVSQQRAALREHFSPPGPPPPSFFLQRGWPFVAHIFSLSLSSFIPQRPIFPLLFTGFPQCHHAIFPHYQSHRSYCLPCSCRHEVPGDQHFLHGRRWGALCLLLLPTQSLL